MKLSLEGMDVVKVYPYPLSLLKTLHASLQKAKQYALPPFILTGP